MKPCRVETAQDKIDKRDEELRREEELRILELSKGLTNGHSGNLDVMGEVIHWQTKTQIAHGEILRDVAAILPRLQAKDDCALTHAGKTGKIALFGETWKFPITATIMCYFVYKLLIHYDPAFNAMVGQ